MDNRTKHAISLVRCLCTVRYIWLPVIVNIEDKMIHVRYINTHAKTGVGRVAYCTNTNYSEYVTVLGNRGLSTL